MDDECRPAPGTKDGTWHVLWLPEAPETRYWHLDKWWLDRNSTRPTDPVVMAASGWTYGFPIPEPPRPLTAEEMQIIARQALSGRESFEPRGLEGHFFNALAVIAKGTLDV